MDRRILATILALGVCKSRAFFAPVAVGRLLRWSTSGSLHRDPESKLNPATGVDSVDEDEGQSRRDFLGKGLAGASMLGLLTAEPNNQALAADFGGLEITGVEVKELLHPGAGESSGNAKKPLLDCLINIERVSESTKQLEDDLTNSTPPPGLKGIISGLVRNYKLEESLQQGALYIENSADRMTAASNGREAVEFMALAVEYFPPEIDDRTGRAKATLSPEALEFTINALGATREKLNVFLSKAPPGVLAQAKSLLKAES